MSVPRRAISSSAAASRRGSSPAPAWPSASEAAASPISPPSSRASCSTWRAHGMAPFIFPAMGSHGAATPEGQADVLAHFGITEQSMGCPIISRADVVSLGKTDDGIEVFMDAAAHAADAVMIVARVKWHTIVQRPTRKRPDEDDGHRPGEVCRRAEIPHARSAARPRARHPHGGPPGAAVGKDDRRPGDPRRCAPQHRKARGRAGRLHGTARRREPRAGEVLDAQAALRSRRPHRRRDGQEHQRHGHGRESRQSRARAANTTPGRDCRRSGGSSSAISPGRPMATRWASGWRTSRPIGSCARSIGSRHGSTR